MTISFNHLSEALHLNQSIIGITRTSNNFVSSRTEHGNGVTYAALSPTSRIPVDSHVAMEIKSMQMVTTLSCRLESINQLFLFSKCLQVRQLDFVYGWLEVRPLFILKTKHTLRESLVNSLHGRVDTAGAIIIFAYANGPGFESRCGHIFDIHFFLVFHFKQQ